MLISFTELRSAVLGFLLALAVISFWPARLAYLNVAKGVVFNPVDRSIIVPASQPASTLFDYLSLGKYRELLEREVIPLSAIRAVRERELSRFAGHDIIMTNWYLDIEGTFGLRAIRFRDLDKRAEAHARLHQLLVDAPAPSVQSRIPRTANPGAISS